MVHHTHTCAIFTTVCGRAHRRYIATILTENSDDIEHPGKEMQCQQFYDICNHLGKWCMKERCALCSCVPRTSTALLFHLAKQRTPCFLRWHRGLALYIDVRG